jgi:hypothetical protein
MEVETWAHAAYNLILTYLNLAEYFGIMETWSNYKHSSIVLENISCLALWKSTHLRHFD